MVVIAAVAALLAKGGGAELPKVQAGTALAGMLGSLQLPGLPQLGTPPGGGLGHADIPASYGRLYASAGRRYGVPPTVLAGIGKIESNHGRSRLPGVRSGSNSAGACGPMQIGCIPGSKAGNSWARYGRGSPYRPEDAIPAAARYLVGHGAHRNLDRAIYGYNHDWGYVTTVKAWARRYGGS
jgi:soluble lytic murein transglycosylase-like protein